MEKRAALYQKLTELEEAISALSVAKPKPDLMAIFAEIDQMASDLPSGTPPPLVHYLRRKSYRKARLFLEGKLEE